MVMRSAWGHGSLAVQRLTRRTTHGTVQNATRRGITPDPIDLHSYRWVPISENDSDMAPIPVGAQAAVIQFIFAALIAIVVCIFLDVLPYALRASTVRWRSIGSGVPDDVVHSVAHLSEGYPTLDFALLKVCLLYTSPSPRDS